MDKTRSVLTKGQCASLAILGLNLYQQGKIADAQVIFQGLASDDSFYGYAGLGAVALSKEPPELDEAQRNLSRAAELNPNDPSVHTNLGEVYLHQKKFAEAGSELQKALDLDREKRDPSANRARALMLTLPAEIRDVPAQS